MEILLFAILLLNLSVAEKVLVTEHLPTIDKLLEELEMTHLTDKFYSSGFTETRYILRMKDMDLRIMAMEWGVEKEQIVRVKGAHCAHGFSSPPPPATLEYFLCGASCAL